MHDRMFLPVIAAWLYINAPAFAGDAVNYNESTLTGDWGGVRAGQFGCDIFTRWRKAVRRQGRKR